MGCEVGQPHWCYRAAVAWLPPNPEVDRRQAIGAYDRGCALGQELPRARRRDRRRGCPMILLALVGAALACRCPDVPPDVVPAGGATISPDQAFTVLGFAEAADLQFFDERGRPVPSHAEPAANGAWIVRPDRRLRRGHSYHLVSWPLPDALGDAHFGAWRYTVGTVAPSPARWLRGRTARPR